MGRIYVLGNPLLKEDAMPIKILPKIKILFPNTEFVVYDPTEELPMEKYLVLIDTIMGIKKVTLLDDIDRIEFNSTCSLHDFDLSFQLKLMKKLGKIKEVNIVGVPFDGDQKVIIKELRDIISSLILKSE